MDYALHNSNKAGRCTSTIDRKQSRHDRSQNRSSRVDFLSRCLGGAIGTDGRDDEELTEKSEFFPSIFLEDAEVVPEIAPDEGGPISLAKFQRNEPCSLSV